MQSINIAITEDDHVTRENVRIYFDAHPLVQVKLVASSVEELLEKSTAYPRPQIDLLLLDIGLPGMTGIQGIPLIKAQLPDTDIVMFTTYEEDDKIFPALCAGACGYITKRTPLAQILSAVLTIFRGGSYMSPSIARKVVQHFATPKVKKKTVLTPRQSEIVDGLVAGQSYQSIANALNISLDTVRDHIRRIYRLLDVNSKLEVIKKSLDGEI